MGVLDTLRDMGGCAGGVAIYEAAKRLAQVRNVNRKTRRLKPETICRLRHLFPGLDLSRVRFNINASLPGNWYTSANNVAAMTFGYKIYFKGSRIQRTEEGLQLLMHELVHVDQVRRRGNSELNFACDYGEGYLEAGNYENNPLEVEAREFVANNPVPSPCTYDSERKIWLKIAHGVYIQGDTGDLLQWTWTRDNSWQLENLSTRVGGNKIGGDPSGYSWSGYQYVYVRGEDGNLLQWTWTPQHGWQQGNLSTRVGGNKIGGDPSSYSWDGNHYVYVRGEDGALLQWTWTQQHGWRLENLSTRVGGEKIAGDPSSYSWGGYHYVYVRGEDGNLLQWTWTQQHGWRLENLSTRVGGEKIAGDPSSYSLFIPWSRNHYVYARGESGDLLQWTWTSQDGWQQGNLSTRVGGEKIVGDPSTYSWGGNHYVYARGESGDLLQWTWTSQDGWQQGNLSTRVGGVKISGGPSSYSWSENHYVYVRGESGDLLQWTWTPQDGWQQGSLSGRVGGTKVSDKPESFAWEMV